MVSYSKNPTEPNSRPFIAFLISNKCGHLWSLFFCAVICSQLKALAVILVDLVPFVRHIEIFCPVLFPFSNSNQTEPDYQFLVVLVQMNM